MNPTENNLEDVDNDDVLSTPETFGIPNEKPSDVYANYSTNELYNLLEEAVQNEDYEKAAKIRDEIDKRERNDKLTN